MIAIEELQDANRVFNGNEGDWPLEGVPRNDLEDYVAGIVNALRSRPGGTDRFPSFAHACALLEAGLHVGILAAREECRRVRDAAA